jgi:hypothetical protein
VVDGGVCVLVEAVMAVVVERANGRSKAIDMCPVLAHASREEKSDARAGNARARESGGGEERCRGRNSEKCALFTETQICHRLCGVSWMPLACGGK